MSEAWWTKWIGDYLGSESEADEFCRWWETAGDEASEEPGEEHLEEFRGTGWWTDAFMDFAYYNEYLLDNEEVRGDDE